MNGGPSGFNNAPVTKTFVIASAIFTIFLRIKGGPNKLGLSYQDIFRNPRLWRLILSVFAFSSTPEMMFGLYLLYYFRVFERQIGSNKYLVFILFSVIVSLLFEVFAVALLKGDFSANVLSAALQSCPTIKCLFYADPSADLPTSGPYGLIFASFVPFYFDIPVSTRFHIFSNHFSDKSFIYLAGVQLLFSSWKRSILPGICGILAGSLYRLNLFGIRKAKVFALCCNEIGYCELELIDLIQLLCFRLIGKIPPQRLNIRLTWFRSDICFPKLIAPFFSWLSWPYRGSPQGATTRNVTGSALSHAGRHVEASLSITPTTLLSPSSAFSPITFTIIFFIFPSPFFSPLETGTRRTYPAPMAPSTEPTEDAIATLVSMGFDRSSARQALVQARNDINTATNILLEAVSH
ncbi:hypothetical protein POTOM_052393 [Populus tomentosa]|uniref:UBA domain-containing protein n=1 Tax=Populus tomentosa TaxID=118781 RepID=A0A8X8C782_POPTO|nr:hypothetical protein POTOM_052393 [Populus tomentosa]